MIDRWTREDLSPGENTFLEGAQVSPDAGRESTRRPSSPAQRITIKKFTSHIDTGVLPDSASTSDLPQDTSGKHAGVIRTTFAPRS